MDNPTPEEKLAEVMRRLEALEYRMAKLEGNTIQFTGGEDLKWEQAVRIGQVKGQLNLLAITQETPLMRATDLLVGDIVRTDEPMYPPDAWKDWHRITVIRDSSIGYLIGFADTSAYWFKPGTLSDGKFWHVRRGE